MGGFKGQLNTERNALYSLLFAPVGAHCFLSNTRFKPVWAHFTPLLSALLSFPFSINCVFIFFYQFPRLCRKNQRILPLYNIKIIFYDIWVFRIKATFHTRKERSMAIIKYITSDVKKRILIGKHRFSPAKFRSLWTHPALCYFRANAYLD